MLFILFCILISICYAVTPTACDSASVLQEGETTVSGTRKLPESGTFGQVTVPSGAVLCAGRNNFDVSFQTIRVMDGGTFSIGESSEPYPAQFRGVITFRDVAASDGQGLVVQLGGEVHIYSSTHDQSWLKLHQPAEQNDTVVFVTTDVFQGTDTLPGGRGPAAFSAPTAAWVGEALYFTSTDYDNDHVDRDIVVASVSSAGGNVYRIALETPLEYNHYSSPTETAERGEVALLTRNVKFQGEAVASRSGELRKGCHVMFENPNPDDIDMPAGTFDVQVHGLEVTQCGQAGDLGRYPLHMHRLGNRGDRVHLSHNSVHDNFQRSIVVHGTHNSVVEYNVMLETFGHAMFLEDAVERLNFVRYNLIGNARQPAGADQLIPSDRDPTNFWITNMDNYIDYNVASGSDNQRGMWMALPDGAMGPSLNMQQYAGVAPNNIPALSFQGNEAHSNGDGFFLDISPRAAVQPADQTLNGPNFRALAIAGNSSSLTYSRFTDMLAWKNTNRGFWTRGSGIYVDRARFISNAIGVTHATNTLGSVTANSDFQGFTDNVGTPSEWNEYERNVGHALPKRYGSAWNYPIRGFEYYDGPRNLRSSTCSRYPKDPLIPLQSCVSVLRNNRFSMTTDSTLSGVTVLDDSTKIAFPDFDGDGARSVTFWDMTQFGGVDSRSVAVANPFFKSPDDGCTVVEEENYMYCPDRRFLGWRISNLAYADACDNGFCQDATTAIQRSTALIAPFVGYKPSVYLRNLDNPDHGSVLRHAQKLIGPPASGNACCPDLEGNSADLTAPSEGYSTTVPKETNVGLMWGFATPSRFAVSLRGEEHENVTSTVHACVPCGIEDLFVGRSQYSNTPKDRVGSIDALVGTRTYVYTEGDPSEGCKIVTRMDGGDGLYVRFTYPSTYGPTSAALHCNFFSDLKAYYDSSLSSASEVESAVF